MTNLYSTPSLMWALCIYNVMGTGAGEDTSASCVWLHVPFRSSRSSFPSCERRGRRVVSGPAARSLPSSVLPRSLSGTGSCCSSGRTCLRRRTCMEAKGETWSLCNSRGTQKDSLLAKLAGFPTEPYPAPSNISVRYPADTSLSLERVSLEYT